MLLSATRTSLNSLSWIRASLSNHKEESAVPGLFWVASARQKFGRAIPPVCVARSRSFALVIDSKKCTVYAFSKLSANITLHSGASRPSALPRSTLSPCANVYYAGRVIRGLRGFCVQPAVRISVIDEQRTACASENEYDFSSDMEGKKSRKGKGEKTYVGEGTVGVDVKEKAWFVSEGEQMRGLAGRDEMMNRARQHRRDKPVSPLLLRIVEVSFLCHEAEYTTLRARKQEMAEVVSLCLLLYCKSAVSCVVWCRGRCGERGRRGGECLPFLFSSQE